MYIDSEVYESLPSDYAEEKVMRRGFSIGEFGNLIR